MQTLHSGVSFQIHKPILCGIHWARCPSRSKVACRSQEPEAASQCRCPQQTKHQNPSPFEAQHQACTSKPPGSDAQQSRYTSSALSNGVDSWQHNAQMGTGRGRSIGCNMGDSSTDWDLLGEAAADIARYKIQQQANSSSSGSSNGGSGGNGSSNSRRFSAFLQQWADWLRDFPGWLQYRYYNWRQDTMSDLLVVTWMSLLVLCSAAVVKHSWLTQLNTPEAHGMAPTAAEAHATTLQAYSAEMAAAASAVVAAADSAPAASNFVVAASAGGAETVGLSGLAVAAPTVTARAVDGASAYVAWLWDALYEVLILSFGEGFPPADVTTPAEGAFSLMVALVGLAGFALALALVEQIVLETNLANVSRGSRVYESNHYLVLGWAVAQRDLEVIIKVVGQLCSSARSQGGTTIVVLTQREKLDMEELFRRTIPLAARHGSRIVFRQGSPLLPSDLSNVAAGTARAIVVVSDESKNRDEADAQSLRCAILLEELDNYRGLRKGMALGHIVVETQTSNAVPLLYYSCSKRVMALPTSRLNARRVAAMVKRPFVSWVTQRIWDFDSNCCVHTNEAKAHVGMCFGDVPFLYPEAIILGVTIKGRVCLNPRLDYRVNAGDQLVLCRAADVSPSAYKHMPLLSIAELEWLGQKLAEEQEAPGGAAGRLLQQLGEVTWNAWPAGQSNAEASSSSGSISRSSDSNGGSGSGCGSGSSSTSRQQEQQPPGGQRHGGTTGIANRASSRRSHSKSKRSSSGNGGSTVTQYGRCGIITASDGREESTWSWSWTSGSSGSADWLVHEAVELPAEQEPLVRAEHTMPQDSPVQHVPQEYLCVDSSPEAVLVAGWSGAGFMSQLLWELDKGTYHLPAGSEIVFANPHMARETLGLLMGTSQCTNVKVSHVMLDPLRRDQLASLPLHRLRAAIVLADEGWCSSDNTYERHTNSPTVSDATDQPGVLTQDALIVMVQLNIRKLLDEAGLPPINIICEKVANQGLTRFEDRQRLPLGISVNFNSLSAKLLTQVAVNPMALTVLTKLGGPVALRIVDASTLCARGELLSFWSVLKRSQAAGFLLLGYYILPSRMDQPIESTVNPVGLAARSRKRVWNTGEGRLKFIIIGDKAPA